jgi:acetyl-CoA carboxylase biotin carboxylase subunit
MFERVLVANRGEIARRVIAGCRALGIETVAVYSEADADALHVREADVAVEIGPAPPRDSYLRIDTIVDAMRESGADAVHPGYGFLSENAEFARAVEAAGATFVGPSPIAIETMGHKEKARAQMDAAGVPVVPGSALLADAADALQAAEGLGYPVMVKAAAGGGGIGLVPCRDASGLERAFASASRRAESAFGNGELYLDRLVAPARHIEVQIAADRDGATVHLFERECSVQRRHQKVLEETPSPGVDTALREALGAAAVRAAKSIEYTTLGTVEFLLARDGAFYFMEMNTRLQVEHPVTEWTTGVDLVALQLQLAAGEPLPFRQEELAQRGHAIEMRLYAENPDKNFLPSPGTISTLQWPRGENVRVDAGVEAGSVVTPFYDPLLAKLIVGGATRAAAIENAAAALRETRVEGIATNLATHAAILADDSFRRGEVSTDFLSELIAARRT